MTGKTAERKRYRSHRSVLSAILAAFLCISLSTTSAYAAETHYLIQMAVNETSWTVEGAVVIDNIGLLGSALEARRFSKSELDSLSTTDGSIQGVLGGLASAGEREMQDAVLGIGSAKENLVLSFPGETGRGGGDADEARAQMIRDALVFDLNAAIAIAYPNRTGWSMATFESNMKELTSALPSESVGSATFSPMDLSGDALEPFLLDDTVSASDYVKVTSTSGETHYLLWRIQKGYAGSAHPKGLRAASKEDTAYITWETLLFEAIGNTLLSGDNQVSASSVTVSSPNALEKAVVALFGSIVTGIRGILGLWSLDQLVFNAGNRGHSSYIHGVFPSGWEPVIWAFFALSEMLALVFLLYSIINNVLRRAAATTNLMGRMRAWEQLKDIAVVAVALAMLPVFLNILMSLSFNLTGVIRGATLPDTIAELRSDVAASSGSIGGAIVQIMYLGIDIYYNFFYLLRSMTVAVLIIVSPICLVASTFDSKYKMMAGSWVKELLANVLIQPIHALVFTLILLVPTSSHKIDNIIMVYATIPLTMALRTMFFGTAGGLSDRVASIGKQRVMGTMAAATGSAVGAAVGGVLTAKGHSKSSAPGESQEGERGSDDAADGNSAGSASPAAEIAAEPSAAGQGLQTNAATGSAGFAGGSEPHAEPAQNMFSRANDAIAEAKQSITDSMESVREWGRDVGPGGVAKAVAGRAVRVAAGGFTFAGGVALGATSGALRANGIGLGPATDRGAQQIVASSKNIAFGPNGSESSYSAWKQQRDGEHAQALGNAAGAFANAPAESQSGNLGNDAPLQSGVLEEGFPDGAVGEETPWLTNAEAEDVFHGNSNEFPAENDPLYYGEMSHDRMYAQMDETALKEAGMSRVYGNKEKVEFNISGTAAKEYAAYNSLLNSLPAAARADMVKSTGVNVQDVLRRGQPTGTYKVTINKDDYRQATGARVNTTRDAPGISVSTPTGGASLVPHVQANRIERPNGEGSVPVRQSVAVSPTTAVRMLNGVETSSNTPAVYSLGTDAHTIIGAERPSERVPAYADTTPQVVSAPVRVHEERPSSGMELSGPGYEETPSFRAETHESFAGEAEDARYPLEAPDVTGEGFSAEELNAALAAEQAAAIEEAAGE